MTAMSRTVKSIIFFSGVGIAVGIGVTVLIVYNPTVGTMFFQGTADEENGSSYPGGSVPALGYLTYYKAILAVGEEGRFDAYSKFGKAPFSFEWKFSDGLSLTGQNVTRSFDSPGRYFFTLTVTDGTGDKVTSTQLHTDVVQEMPPKEEVVTANATSSMQ
jgi:hypothetical protein